MILTVTLVCCGAIFILAAFYIPYFIYVESILKKMIDFIYLTDHASLNRILKACKEFQDFVDNNKFLKEEK